LTLQVTMLGGAWVVWLVQWELWVASCCYFYAREVRSWKLRLLLSLLITLVLPACVGYLPFTGPMLSMFEERVQW
jgi:hypothetical protein